MDREIGRNFDQLDSLDIADNTSVIFTSDDGHFLCQHGLWLKGRFHYEDAIRVPFIMRWKNGWRELGSFSPRRSSLVSRAAEYTSDQKRGQPEKKSICFVALH